MAPIKRKTGPTNESFVRSKRSSENGDRPSKRPRQEDSISQKPKLESDTKSSTSFHPIKIAKSKEEEAAFPRGGASILTPLEHKQIQIDATRDVLFEQKAAKGKTQELEEVDITLEQGNSKKRKPKAKGKKTAIKEAEIEDTVKIEGLSYKVCVAGKISRHSINTFKASSARISCTGKSLPDQCS
jgi:rRNA biogenesis protein RRP5